MSFVTQKYKHPYDFYDLLVSTKGMFKDYSKELINEVKKYYPERNIYLTNKGRESLNIILKNLNLNENDEIAIPSNVCEVVIETILYNKLKPLIIDITDNLTLDPKDLARKKTSKTKAVIIVHHFGNIADLDEITKSNLIVIEDCAQTIDGKYKGKIVGNFADYSFNSLDITKPISAISGSILVSKKPLTFKLKNSLGLKNLIELKLFIMLNNKLIYNLITKRFITKIKQKQTLNFKIENKAMSKISMAIAYSQYKKYPFRKNYARKIISNLKNIKIYSEENELKTPSYTVLPVKLNKNKLKNILDLPQPSPPLIYLNKYKPYYSYCPNTEKIYRDLTLIQTHTDISGIKWERYII
ncbi:MAG: DegT/DnrJ/EryC1/StrS family aminotransferase [Candidatus Nanoarchaeia archaeon]|nr:DegT/DnrJ/EryC1/StrS family aminotransferase [Candidatus Nanoarchaeia archaeon]